MALTDVPWLLEPMDKTIVMDSFPEILGHEATAIWIDEWSDYQWPKLLAVEASFKNPKWPTADVTVEEEILRPTDPRHPNPKAGPIKEYVVIAGGRRARPQRSKTQAMINAENLHKRLVAALEKDIDDQLSANPTYRMF